MPAAPVLPHSTARAADITNSRSGTLRNWYLNVVSRFWKPLALGLPGWLRCVQVDPMETPKYSVIRLEYSVDRSSWRTGGSSPVLDQVTVGKESSSATQGSSMPSVAGKKRAPMKQCARASVAAKTAMAVSGSSKAADLDMDCLHLNAWESAAGSSGRRSQDHQAKDGGAREA